MRGGQDRSLDAALETAVRELDAMRAHARTARGDARDSLLDRLRGVDAALVEAVSAGCSPETLRQLGDEADEELRPFRNRLPPDSYQKARIACVARLLRDRARIPALTYE
jgi:hypothetical protein